MKRIFIKKILHPILHSAEPVHEVALGVAIGTFYALTPTVGIQMALVMITWFILIWVRLSFSPVVGVAMVWISNPLTIGPMYYLFWKTGKVMMSCLGLQSLHIDYDSFIKTGKAIFNTQGTWAKIKAGFDFFVLKLGISMLVGSLVYAIPCAIGGYIFISFFLRRHRRRKAKHLGMTYEEWKKEHERSLGSWIYAKSHHQKKD